MTFKIYKHKLSGKGRSLVFILQPGDHKLLTGYYCKDGSWDQKSQSVKVSGPLKDPDGSTTNYNLNKSKIALQQILDKTRAIKQIRIEYSKYLESLLPKYSIVDSQITIDDDSDYYKLTASGKDFYLLIEKLITSHKSVWSEGYQRRFKSVRSKILDYEPNFHMTMLTEEWWREFVTYCIEERDNVSNTIHADSKIISRLIEETTGDKALAEKISWSYIEPDILGLSWEKVSIIKTLDLSNHPDKTVSDSRTVWLAGAFTGRRWEEISTAQPSNFYQKGTQWRYKNIGKGNKLIDIPLLDEAVDFFKSINFTLPKISPVQVNLDIKSICKLAGFKEQILVITPISPNEVVREIKEEWETVHFHTSRHSYGQHIAELAAGRPHAEKFVSYMLGHASHQTTWKYMNRSSSSHDQMFDEIMKK
jgi:integrase